MGGGGGGGMYGENLYFPPYSMILLGILFLVFIFTLSKMADAKFRLRDLINVGGVIIGIALTAIGSIFVLNTVLKLYVFHFDTPPYFSAEEMCQYDYNARPMTPDGGPVKLEGEAYDKCVTEKTDLETTRYVRQKKESMIDGLAMMLVGIPFWMIFGIRRRRD